MFFLLSSTSGGHLKALGVFGFTSLPVWSQEFSGGSVGKINLWLTDLTGGDQIVAGGTPSGTEKTFTESSWDGPTFTWPACKQCLKIQTALICWTFFSGKLKIKSYANTLKQVADTSRAFHAVKVLKFDPKSIIVWLLQSSLMCRGVSLPADRPCCKTRLYNTVKSSSSQSFYTTSCINKIGLRCLLVYLVSQPQ